MRSRLELSVRTRGVLLEAGINDAPFLCTHDGRSLAARMPTDPWITPDSNALTLTVSPVDDATAAPLVDVALGPPGEGSPAIVRLAWSNPRGCVFEPFRVELPFTCSDPVPTTLWRDVPAPVELDDAALALAREVGLRLHAAMAARDVAAVLELVRYRTDETARALGFDPEENTSAVRASFEALLHAPGFALRPVRAADLRVAPCAGERAFHLTRRDGRELVVTAGTTEMSMQVYVAPIDNVWRVVR